MDDKVLLDCKMAERQRYCCRNLRGAAEEWGVCERGVDARLLLRAGSPKQLPLLLEVSQQEQRPCRAVWHLPWC